MPMNCVAVERRVVEWTPGPEKMDPCRWSLDEGRETVVANTGGRSPGVVIPIIKGKNRRVKQKRTWPAASSAKIHMASVSADPVDLAEIVDNFGTPTGCAVRIMGNVACPGNPGDMDLEKNAPSASH
jgi:hypothetical protein